MFFRIYEEGVGYEKIASYLLNAILYLMLLLFGVAFSPRFGIGVALLSWLIFTFGVLVIFSAGTLSKGKSFNFRVARLLPLVIIMTEGAESD